jgi:NADH pyrophosphatase NudC (nudix superfamily)
MMGESYEDAAKRELQEELCVECRLQFVDKIFGDFSSDYPNLRYFTGVFLGRYSGKIKLNEELADAVRFSIADIEKLIKDKKEMFTPGFIREFHAIKEKLKK